MAANGFHYTRVGDNWFPVGFRFSPTEEELINYYLQMKLQGMDDDFGDVIPEINICDYEPRDLPGLSLIKSDDQGWYFFSTNKKNNKNQTKRATKEGFWKSTGDPKPVKTEDKRTVIGEKRILTFKQGRGHKSQNTDWVMHEYYIPQTNPNANQRDLVVCCVRKKSGENVDAANCHERESSTYNNASNFENQQLPTPRMDIEEEHTQQQLSMDYFESAQYRMLASASGNDYHGMPSAFGANEQHDQNFIELLNSFDWDVILSELPVYSSHSRGQEDVMLYQTQAASSVNVVPKPQTDRLQVVTDEHSGIHHRQLVNDEHSGTHQRTSRPQRESRHNNALNVKNASSVDVDAELPQINCIRLATDEYYNNERTRGRTYPTSALEALSKQKELKQQQSKAKEAAERQAAVDFPPEKTSITKCNKEAEVAQGNNAEKGLQQTQNATTAGNWKGCFISWETSPPLTSPPSVYLFNMVVGVIMFCVFAREAVLYGQWC